MNAFFGSAGPAVAPATRRRTEVPRIDAGITVQALTTSQWRVCDTRWPEHDARCVLGFIEKRGEAFEVLRIHSGLERLTFGSLAEATRYFSAGVFGSLG